MADNLYIASVTSKGKVKYCSLDGAKMESAHTKEDMVAYIGFINE